MYGGENYDNDKTSKGQKSLLVCFIKCKVEMGCRIEMEVFVTYTCMCTPLTEKIDKVAPLSVSGNILELPLLAASLEFEYHLWLVQEI